MSWLKGMLVRRGCPAEEVAEEEEEDELEEDDPSPCDVATAALESDIDDEFLSPRCSAERLELSKFRSPQIKMYEYLVCDFVTSLHSTKMFI